MTHFARSLFVLSVAAAIGAYAVVSPQANSTPAPAAPKGKIAERLPAAQPERPAGEEILVRIRASHGLDAAGRRLASVDCKAFAWPNIPGECLTAADGGVRAKPVRLITPEARSLPAPVTTPVAAPAPARRGEARTVRN